MSLVFRSRYLRYMTGFGGSSGGILGAEVFLKKSEETLDVSWVS